MTTLDMFEHPPRAKPQKLMHVWLVGNADCGTVEIGYKPFIRFMCAKCSHKTDWLNCYTATEAKRGIACPHCNKAN